MKKIGLKNLAILLIFWAGLSLACLGQGIPFMENYSPQQYRSSAQIWTIAEDHQGLLYFGTNSGVLEYDGNDWNLTNIINGVFSLAESKEDGRLYVGSASDFGVMETSPIGKYEYHSLAKGLEDSLHYSTIWYTHAVGAKVYFMAEEALFIYDVIHQKLQVVHAPTAFLAAYVYKGHYIIKCRGKGLGHVVKGKFELYKGGANFEHMPVTAFLPYDAHKVFVGAQQKGAYLVPFEEEKGGGLSFGTPQEMSLDFSDYLKENVLYYARDIGQGRYAIATFSGGLLIMDKEGHLLNKLGKKEGLQNEEINNLFLSSAGDLWLATEKGITRLEINTPFRQYNEKSGVEGITKALGAYKGNLYAGTSEGLYELHQHHFTKVPHSPKGIWDIQSFKTPDQDTVLLITGVYGFHTWDGHRLKKVSGLGVTGLSLHVSQRFPNRVYIGTAKGLRAYELQGSKWREAYNFPSINEEVISFAEDSLHNLWMGTFYQGALQIKWKNESKLKPALINHYDTLNGLPNLQYIHVSNVEGTPVLTTINGLYAYNPKADTIELYQPLKKMFPNRYKGVVNMYHDPGEFWFCFSTFGREYLERIHFTQGKMAEVDSMIFKRLPEMEVNDFAKWKGQMWVAGNAGLFACDLSHLDLPPHKFRVNLRKVKALGDSLLYEGHGIDKVLSKEIHLPYSRKPIVFQYAANFYRKPQEMQYQYKLAGYEDTWSTWTTESKREFTNLPEGKYNFLVRARNFYGQETPPAIFTLFVDPPWWRTVWAETGAVLIFISLVWSLVMLNTYRLRRQKQILENNVAERTQEIKEKNEELENQNEEISSQRDLLAAQKLEIEIQKNNMENQNRMILDSMNAAQKIQQAILPSHKTFDRYFAETGLFYRPRDIVSGDLYYAQQTTGGLFCAVMDCTGHGVPGAIMSMLANDALNDILSKDPNLSPAEVLDRLDDRIIHTLKQDSGDNADGLDIGLMKWMPGEKELLFAGARRSLWYWEKGSEAPQLIRGSRQPIGGIRLGNEHTYENRVLHWQNSLQLFLFSDGFPDQFGGVYGRKLMLRRFYQLLQELAFLPGEEQSAMLEKRFEDWKGMEEAIDDVLVLGLQIY